VEAATIPTSAWSPFRYPVYRALWTAQLGSNVGTWTQLVGAQWLVGNLGGSVALVAAIQTAMTLPVVLLAMPGGALGDIFDRRLVLLASQGFMCACAGVLTALTLADRVTPATVLAFTFALGAGQAVQLPCWQAVQPELVSREEIPRASALAGISMNVARALGPALGGVVIALAAPEWCFALNAASFAVVTIVVARWRRTPAERALGAEHLGAAIRAGLRYVGASPRLRTVLLRGAVFVTCASAVWALLPIVARDDLMLGSAGYGLLLGLVGVGAVAGAFALSRLRRRWSTNRIVATCSLTSAAAAAAVAFSESVVPTGLALLLAGASWIGVMASLNATAQLTLPTWVRARGMSMYLTVFFGGQAVGGVVWGLVAQEFGTETALLVVAAGLVAGSLTGLRRPIASTKGVDLSTAEALALPEFALDRDPSHGPVLVTVAYRVPPENHDAFREVLSRRGRARRRSGAEHWALYQDSSDPDRFTETFLVPTWEEHLRQHGERLTALDLKLRDETLALVEPGSEPVVEHLVHAYDA
jgi:MFS family permease